MVSTKSQAGTTQASPKLQAAQDAGDGRQAVGGDAAEARSTAVNVAVLRGSLSSDPSSRVLPSGEVIHSYEVTVRESAQPAASVPVVLVGGPAPKGLSAGDEVVVVGRVRRRFFRAGGGTASRTEVVADRVIPARRATTSDRALDQAVARLGGARSAQPASTSADGTG